MRLRAPADSHPGEASELDGELSRLRSTYDQ